MASIAARMTALGAAHETCAGCDTRFPRGATMTAVAYDDGTPAGWFCDTCLRVWTETGDEPKPAGKEQP